MRPLRKQLYLDLQLGENTMNRIKKAVILSLILSSACLQAESTPKPNRWIYYAAHSVGNFLYDHVTREAVASLASLFTPANPFADLSAEGAARATFSDGRLALVITLAQLYGSFKLPELINRYCFGDTHKRSTAENLQSLLLRKVIPYSEISAPVSEFLVDGYDNLAPQE